MPYPNEHAARIMNPDAFERFRREKDGFGEGIDVVWGIHGSDVKVQSIRFDKGRFSPEDALNWLRLNQYEPTDFEPATTTSQFADKEEPKADQDKTHEFEAEIFSVGTWNGDKYTDKDLDEMVKNFSELRSRLKPFIKLGHSNKQEKEILKDGQPALGWVKALRRDGDKLFARFTEVPTILMKAIKQGLYKRVSSEIFWNFRLDGKVYKRALSAVALLGATIPAVSNLADLTAYLSKQIPASDNVDSFDRLVTYELEVENPTAENKNKEGEKRMSEELATQMKEFKEELNTLRTELAEKDAVIKDYKAKEDERTQKDYEAKREATFKEVREYCDKAVSGGTMTPASRDALVGRVSLMHYSLDEGVSISWDAVKEFHETTKTAFEFTEKGLHKDKKEKEEEDKQYASAGEKVEALTREYMKKNDVKEYSVALEAVLASDKALAEAYVMGGKIDG